MVRTILAVFLAAVVPTARRGQREHPGRRAVHPRPDASQHHRHAGGVGSHPSADALPRRGQVVVEQVVRPVAVRARRLPRQPRQGRPRGVAPVHRPAVHVGEPLVLFPEGERKSGPLVLPLRDGAAYIAVKSGVPIVPVGIGGSERVMPRGANFIKPRKIVALVGEADRRWTIDDSGSVPACRRARSHRAAARGAAAVVRRRPGPRRLTSGRRAAVGVRPRSRPAGRWPATPDRWRRTARVPSAWTAAARRRRRSRCPGGWP